MPSSSGLIWYLLVLFILLILSAMFTAFEAAIFNSSTIKLKSSDKKKHIAKKIVDFKKNPERIISSIVLGNNLANIFFTSIMTILVVEYTLRYSLSGSIQVIIATIISTVVIVVLGETVPKNIGSFFPEKTSLLLYNIFSVFWYILYPFSYLLSKIGTGFLRIFGIKTKEKKTFERQEEVLKMIEIGKEEGVIEKNEEKMIYSIFEFGDTLVREIMTPRVDIVAADEDTEIETIKKIIIESGHSRIPIYHEKIDEVIGVLYVKDLLKIQFEGKRIEDLKDILRQAYFVPETKRVDELFAEMQKSKFQLAMVFDEYGGVSGLVTLEDILEEIVGEIQDEYEKEDKQIQKIAENAFLVLGATSIEDFNERFNTDFSDEEASTIGGLILEKLGRLPNPGEEIRIDKLRFIVSKIRDRRIINVKVILGKREENNEAKAD